MRAIILLAVLALLPSVAASAPLAAPDTGITVDPEASVSPDGCDDCASASLRFVQVIPNCYDCPGLFAYVAVEHDGQQTTAEARACRTGFVSFCPVDHAVTV